MAEKYVKLPHSVLMNAVLTVSDKIVYAAVASFADNGSGEAYPGVRKIAKRAGVHPNTAMRSIGRLIDVGMLGVEHGDYLQHRSNRYKILAGDARDVPPRGTNDVTPEGTSDVTPEGTYLQKCRRRTTTCDDDVTPEGTQLELLNKNQRTRTKGARRAAAKLDPWELACEAMNGDMLNTERFRVAWGEWATHRQEIRKALTPSTIRGQIRKLEEFGHDGAMAAIRQSIEAGWVGLFEPKSNGNGRAPARATPKLQECVKVKVLNG